MRCSRRSHLARRMNPELGAVAVQKLARGLTKGRMNVMAELCLLRGRTTSGREQVPAIGLAG